MRRIRITQETREVVSIEVTVDQITCGKPSDGVFSLQHRKSLVKSPMFPLHQATSSYPYPHHFNMADLNNLFQIDGRLFPYGLYDHDDYSEYCNITVQSWADLMKYRFAQLILTGCFDYETELPDGRYLVLRTKWTGKDPVRPELKYKQDTPKRKSLIQPETFEGLDFFDSI